MQIDRGSAHASSAMDRLAPETEPARREFVASFLPGSGRRIKFDDGLHRMEVSRPVDPVRLKTVEQLAATLTSRTLESPETLALLGTNLYELLFCHEHANEWFEVVYNQEPRGNLRLILEFDASDPEHRSLMALPWEYICVPEQRWRSTPSYLACDGTASVVRRLADLQGAVKQPPRAKVLVVDCLPQASSRPRSRAGQACALPPSLGTDELLEFLERKPELDVACVRFPKQMQLQSEIVARAPDVVHLIGHGRYADAYGGFELCLMPETNLWESDQRIAEAIVRRPPSLVILQSCKGAAGGAARLYPAGVATLATRGVPNVVGLQGEVAQGVASNFAREFYEAMCLGKSAEEAVLEGRLSMKGNSQFGLPVIFVQSEDSFRFPASVQVQDAVPQAAPPPVRGGPLDAERGDAAAAQPVTKVATVTLSPQAPQSSQSSSTVGAADQGAPGGDAAPTAATPPPGGANPLSVRFGRGGA